MARGWKHTEESKKKISLNGKGKGMFGKKHSEETKIKMSEKKQNVSGSNNNMYGRQHREDTKLKISEKKFKGGEKNYWHNKAFELFGSNICEVCNNQETRIWKGKVTRLSMHCTSIPKDYTNMTKENWMCVCNLCHTKIDANGRKS